MRLIALAPVIAGLALAGCAELASIAPEAMDEAPVIATSITTPPPRPTARTVDEFDTTTAQDRAAAVAAASAPGGARLGTTIASLGSPADPGIWLRTPLVTQTTMGRVEHAPTGKSVAVELRPSGGAPGSGSQISLPAMRLLEIPLTALPELVVYR
jgi:hypothetical protein